MRTTPRRKHLPGETERAFQETEGSSSLISNEKLIAIHTVMVRCRTIEKRAELLFQRGKLRSDFQRSVGREASVAAFVIDLRPEDALCLPDEDVLPGLVKGASLEDTLRALGTARDDQHPEQLSHREAELKRLNIASASNANAQIARVREFALSAKQASTGRIVLSFHSGETESRAGWDALMSFAGANGLPVVCVVHGAWRVEEADVRDAMTNGIPTIAVDGGDAVAIYRVACEAIARARQGRGPTLVECIISPASDQIHIRSGHRYSSDPNLTMENYLRRKGLWSEENYRHQAAEVEREFDLATRSLNG